jgi:hypothetical protein
MQIQTTTKSRGRSLRIGLVTMLLTLALAPAARAQIVHTQVAGTVAAIQDDLKLFGNSLTYGQPFTANLFIDPQDPRPITRGCCRYRELWPALQ